MCARVPFAKAEMGASPLWALMPKGVPSEHRPPSHRPPGSVSIKCSNSHSAPPIQLHRVFQGSSKSIASSASIASIASMVLTGLSIAASGRFPSGVTQKALQTRITSLGAEYMSSVTPDTTHLIATQKDFESNSTKVKTAVAQNVSIVSLEWLDECEATGKSRTFRRTQNRNMLLKSQRRTSN